jgi:uncharacterized protein (TIGR01777 family)
MRIAVAGSSGLIGTALVRSLIAGGHDVTRLVRRAARSADEVSWDPDGGDLDPAAVASWDAVVNLCGVNIGDKRWNDEFKKLLRSSRINPTRTLATAIAAASPRPKVLLNASGVGFYGDRGAVVLDESSPPGQGFDADLCQAWEAATGPAEEAGVRVAYLRNGVVLRKGQGLLGRLVPIVKLGIAGKLGSGRQYMACISLTDVVAATQYLLDSDISGPVNLTSPEPVTNAEFMRTLGHLVHRPTIMPVPGFATTIVAGEVAKDVLVSRRVVPAVLQGHGFAFQHPDIESALKAALA